VLDLTSPFSDFLVALEGRTISSRELLELHLERIDRLDPAINAVVTIDEERATAEATSIDDARAKGEHLGPLAGLPITIKDAIATAGMRSTGGAIELAEHVPVEDAAVVARLRNAGAVVFGKTNLPRWSGDYQTTNEMFGTTNNPWDLGRTPGGSSGGAAAAVAMGFTSFEVGTDIGGSVRLPASFCGIYGHKPSFGVVSTFGYLDNPVFHRTVADVNVFGPLARSIDDLRTVFDLLAAPNPDDAVGWRLQLPEPRGEKLADFRVAAWLDDPFSPVEPEVAAVHDTLLDALTAAGARIDRTARPQIEPQSAALLGATLIGNATSISDTEEEHASTVEAGRALSHHDWDLLDRQRSRVRQWWSEFFRGIDILLCPVTVAPPFRHVHSPLGSNFAHSVLADHGDRPYLDLLMWNSLIGSAYLPVTVPPIGRTASGLPIGVQVVAPFLEDRTALAFAAILSDVMGGYSPPPPARSPTG
jgi:amidase